MNRTERALVAAAKAIVSELDLDAVLERVLQSAQELTGARYAALGVLDEAKQELARFIAVGIDESTRRRIGELPRGRGVLGEVIRNPVPLRLPDVGAHPHSYGFPHGHPPMHSFLGVPILIDGEVWGNLYLTEKAEGEFTQQDEEAVIALAELTGIAIDNARRYIGSEVRRDELEHTVEALRASTEISHALAGQTNLNSVLNLVAKRGRALVSARSAVIELRSFDEFVVAATAGEFPPGLVGERLGAEHSVAGQVLRSGRTEWLTDELKRARFSQHGWARYGVDPEAGLFVPLFFRGQTLGVLAAFDRIVDGPHFTDDDRELLEAFAASAATAVATARSVEAERGRQRLAAAEEERRRWARELHDETLQGLAALKLGLTSASHSGGPEGLARAVELAVEQLDRDIGNLRKLISDLRPAALDQLGVESAVTALAERAIPGGIGVDLTVDLAWERGRSSTRLTPEVETAIYRLAQEAVNNAVRHGDPTRISVDIREDDQAVRVTVGDDGRGFDPGKASSGFGLEGMRERVQLLEGRLEIDSELNAGTTVRATLPTVHRRRKPAYRKPVALRSTGES